MNNNLHLDDPAIESPKRTKILIDAAVTIGFDLADLPTLVMDALETEIDTTIFPFYSYMPDRETPDNRAFMIYLIECLSGSDDDHDDLMHDLDHALGTVDPCDEHPGSECNICCEQCYG